jgi:Zn-dependent M16 (insulinase) family peptidase
MTTKALRSIVCLLFLIVLLIPTSSGASVIEPQQVTEQVSLESLHEGQLVSGFKTIALYLDDHDRPIGARFRHQRSGFIFDFLHIQSVPQAFIWVNTMLSNSSGVAHTQEHLLLGKGNKGRHHGTKVQMSLTNESAGTDQWRTYYHFNTVAGATVFYDLFEQYLDLLLNPDYTDEEVRREVRNFAVKEDSDTHKLVLEEKGTVYNEMLAGVKDHSTILWWAAMHTLYGEEHPLSQNNGGTPEGIRALQPPEIRSFHDEKYKLSNMGMLGAFPSSMPAESVLKTMDSILAKFAPAKGGEEAVFSSEFPPFPEPKPKPIGTVQIVNFPDTNPKKAGVVDFLWPANLKISNKDKLLLGFFLSGFAGDADTPLYKIFVDSKTQTVESQATSVYAWVHEELGFPIIIGINDVAQPYIDKSNISSYRQVVLDELQRIASWKDGSKELLDFNQRLLSRLARSRRYYADFVNKPPQFGTRHNSGTLMKQLSMLEREGGFRRSLTLKPDFDAAAKMLKSKHNIWRDLLDQWHLLDTVPYAIGTRPDPEMISRDERESKQRLHDEAERLMKLYKTDDEQIALQKYKADYDAVTHKLEALVEDDAASRKFTDSPPMTTDDELKYKCSTLSGNVPLFTASFDSMSSSNIILYLNLRELSKDDCMYLAVLPELFTQTGALINGKAISYEDMMERIRKEIYYINGDISGNIYSGRCEFYLSVAGTNEEESRRAAEWMKTLLNGPNWEPANLDRIRDVVEQRLSAWRSSRDTAYEEHWDSDVSRALIRQDDALLLNGLCFLTKTHNTQRIRWRLFGGAGKERVRTFSAYMKRLAEVRGSRAELIGLLEAIGTKPPDAVTIAPDLKNVYEEYKKLPENCRSLVDSASSDLAQDLPDIPDQFLHADWKTLCNEIAADVLVEPEQTLKDLNALRQKLLKKSAARMVLVSSTDSQKALQKPMQDIVSGLSDGDYLAVTQSPEPLIMKRWLSRQEEKSAEQPVFIGFVNPNTKQGVVINTCPAIKYSDLDDESLLNALAFSMYGGAGSHGLFMKTWGAGLAYGNGPAWFPDTDMKYYADKMPSIPETLRFVAKQLKDAKKPDRGLCEYAISECFSSRAEGPFESRAAAQAKDIVDGVTPDMVRKFRQAILNLRNRPDLADELDKRKLPQYGKVIPGLGVKAADVPKAVFLAIGDEKQMQLYSEYLRQVDSPDSKMALIYARDFWITADEK